MNRFSRSTVSRLATIFLGVIFAPVFLCAQIPEPGPVKNASIPRVQERVLKNGLRIAVVERRGIPAISVTLLVAAGSDRESPQKAGLSRLTAAMLTKGTTTRTANQIAEETEFNSSSVYGFSRWHSVAVGMGTLTPGFDRGMEIFADVVRNPSFPESELDLLKRQSLASIRSQLNDPNSLALMVGSVYSFNEHPSGGTTTSINSITRADVEAFYKKHYVPTGSVLVFVGDIDVNTAMRSAEKHFDNWRQAIQPSGRGKAQTRSEKFNSSSILRRILVIDLPESGQSSVNYFRPTAAGGRETSDFYTASVLNSLLGGGYSSRLNQEIRIKRGLSYGARSFFGWRKGPPVFTISTQTKDESAAEVAELIVAELKRLAAASANDSELLPRKAVLTGTFARNLETNNGIASAVGDLFSLRVRPGELNLYTQKVNGVTPKMVQGYSQKFLHGGDIVIVGDYSKFREDLDKRFPNQEIIAIKATDLDLDSGRFVDPKISR